MAKFTAQSCVGVGCKKGYPYYAWKEYRLHVTKAGKLVWQCTGVQGSEFRSDSSGKRKLEGLPVRYAAHNCGVTDKDAIEIVEYELRNLSAAECRRILTVVIAGPIAVA